MECEERIAVAYITQPKGLNGQVKAQPLTHGFGRFDELSTVVIQRQNCPDRRLRLEHWQAVPNGILLKFTGIDTPEKAKEQLSSGYVTIAAEELAPRPEGAYYIFELVGCAVQDQTGRLLGEIVEVLTMPSTDVYQVHGPGGELLIPAVEDYIVSISIAERLIVVQGIDELVNHSP